MLARDGSLPVNVSYAAHVQVTRIEPEEYLPPQPGDEVRLAVDQTLATAKICEAETVAEAQAWLSSRERMALLHDRALVDRLVRLD